MNKTISSLLYLAQCVLKVLHKTVGVLTWYVNTNQVHAASIFIFLLFVNFQIHC